MGSTGQGTLAKIAPVKAMSDLYSLHVVDGEQNHYFYLNGDGIRCRDLRVGDVVAYEMRKADSLRVVIEERTGDEKVFF